MVIIIINGILLQISSWLNFMCRIMIINIKIYAYNENAFDQKGFNWEIDSVTKFTERHTHNIL